MGTPVPTIYPSRADYLPTMANRLRNLSGASSTAYTLGRLCRGVLTIAGIGFFAALFEPVVNTVLSSQAPQPTRAGSSATPAQPILQQAIQLVATQAQLRYTITNHQWVEVLAGQSLPPNAFTVGVEGRSGDPLVLCRAVHLGLNRPGKVVGGQCNVPEFESNPPAEVTKAEYEVLVATDRSEDNALGWIPRREDLQDASAYVLFSDRDSIICRATHLQQGEWLGQHPGLMYGDRCLYPYADQVFAAPDYEVLTVQMQPELP